MELLEIRKQIIMALASDDELMESLILKGGNALQVVHEIGGRASVDIDYSLEHDFDDINEVAVRVEAALSRTFAEVGIVVFDFRFEARPRIEVDPRWGGYEAQFKLIDYERMVALGGELEDARRQSVPADDLDRRSFKIQISKFERIEGSQEIDVGDYLVRVYTPTMIAAEKLRALCQQHPDYTKRGYSTSRARDFYDIHAIVSATGVDLTTKENIELIGAMFEAKDVNPEFLSDLSEQEGLHRGDWDSVELSVVGTLRDFDFYFDFVRELAAKIKAAWDE